MPGGIRAGMDAAGIARHGTDEMPSDVRCSLGLSILLIRPG
jgi:hypothetical protein